MPGKYRLHLATLAKALPEKTRRGVLDTLREGESIQGTAAAYGITVEEIIGIMDINVARGQISQEPLRIPVRR